MARRRRRDTPPPDPLAELTNIPPPVEQPQANLSQNDVWRMQNLLAESNRRQFESLKIFTPLPKMEAFHACRKSIRLALGGNRSSKTTTAAVEFARAVTGQDPHDKYPKHDGLWFVFGLDGRHLGNVVYKKVFRAGAFDMIRDAVTGRWRAFNPNLDVGREHLKKPAPPLIPRRFIKSISWEEKKANIPKIITLTNGWEIHFYSSQAELPQGQAIDGAWIDEEVKREDLVAELRARCIDRRGKIIWSATPQSGSNQLFDLHERSGDLDTETFHAHILDNPYIHEAAKEEFFRGLTEEERRVRWDGQFLLSGFVVYPEFSKVVHAWPETTGWQVPIDWARYMSVDPGRQTCAVTFLAVPPPWIGKFVLAYDELYIEKCDADIFGKQVGAKSKGRVYEAALIDGHMGRVSDMGSGRNIEVQYQQALVKYGVQMRNGVGFTWGCDDLQAGLGAVRDWLRIGSVGKPFLFVNMMACPNLVNEFTRYRYAPDPRTKMPTDQPIKKNDHLMDTLRYLAMYGPVWRKPKSHKQKESPAFEAMVRKRRAAADKAAAGSYGMDDSPGIRLG